MPRNKFALIFGIISLISLGWAGYLVVQRYWPLPSLPQETTSRTMSPDEVIQIILPDLKISLPVYQAQLTGTKWEYTSRGVSHLSSTPWPGSIGNSVFYGHNWPNIFSPLHQAQIDSEVILITSGGVRLTYRVSDIQVVTADRIDILDQTPDSRLTIFTCTGFMDSKRLVLTALPV